MADLSDLSRLVDLSGKADLSDLSDFSSLIGIVVLDGEIIDSRGQSDLVDLRPSSVSCRWQFGRSVRFNRFTRVRRLSRFSWSAWCRRVNRPAWLNWVYWPNGLLGASDLIDRASSVCQLELI